MRHHEVQTRQISIRLPTDIVDLMDDVVDRNLRGWLIAWAVHSYVEREGRDGIKRLADGARMRMQHDELSAEASTLIDESLSQLPTDRVPRRPTGVDS